MRPQWAKGRPRRGKRGGRQSEVPQDERHKVKHIAHSKWRCAACWLEVWSRKAPSKFEEDRCPGNLSEACHHTHKLAMWRNTIWCRACGCFATRHLRGLRRACLGTPRSAAAASVRRRLARGLPPTPAGYLLAGEADHDHAILEVLGMQGLRDRLPPAGLLDLAQSSGDRWRFGRAHDEDDED